MNQDQLNLIAKNPQIQELISALDCIEHTPDTTLKTSRAISNRIDSWIADFKDPIPQLHIKSIFNNSEETSKWINANIARYGKSWCPF